MLSFDTALSNALKLGNTSAFWVLKLYYNSEGEQVFQADGTTPNLTNEALDNSETGVNVDDGRLFIANDYIKVESEIMFVVSISSHTLTVVRGARGSTKATHNNNTAIYFDNFIGVSDSHRIDGTDIYHGLVSAWGQYQQSLDFFNFTTSTGNMTVKLINADKSIQGGRFSDFLATKNFANRKWELFLNTSQAGTYDTAARMIGTGIISGDISYDTASISFILLDLSSKYHKRIPANVVASGTYANAPKKNINKPIPMAYGSFSDLSGIGTIPTSGANFDRYFTHKFPAIITDEWDTANSYSEAKIDSVAIDTLDTENIYMKINDHFVACSSSNVTKTEASAFITFKGDVWRAYFPCSSVTGANATDGLFSSSYALGPTNSGNSWDVKVAFAIPQIPKLGDIITTSNYHRVNILISANLSSGTPSSWRIYQISGSNINLASWSSGAYNVTTIVDTAFTADEISSWDFEGSFQLHIDDTGNEDGLTATLYEVGLEVEFAPSKVFIKEIAEQYEVGRRAIGVDEEFPETQDIYETIYKTRTKTIRTPSVSDYIYCSGKGRIYGAWVDADSRNQGYNEDALIENPVFIIEDILRTELSLTSTNIDHAKFDTAGNTSDGHIGLIFDDSVGDIIFAFSQYKFINSKDLINRICKQICSWLWIGGDGKFKIRTLLRSTDTWAEDKIVNYNDINLKSISKTSLNNIRNDITVNYDHHYGQDQSLSSVNTTDSTSQGTTVNGSNQTLKLEIDADGVLDSTTATQLADAYKSIFKDRKIVLGFDCMTPYYNDLEIGDIIKFSNWDSNIKLYGTAMATDYFIIQDISKTVSGCSIKSIKVDN